MVSRPSPDAKEAVKLDISQIRGKNGKNSIVGRPNLS
jgi:hypothetical protein